MLKRAVIFIHRWLGVARPMANSFTSQVYPVRSRVGAYLGRVIDRYGRCYLDRQRRLPLPVILATMNDPDHTRYYIDPKTARVVGGYSERHWVRRWLYNGLHSLNVPWLYNHRPLWDIVVITFMLGGTALSATSIALAWQSVSRKVGFRH